MSSLVHPFKARDGHLPEFSLGGEKREHRDLHCFLLIYILLSPHYMETTKG
jgi:hypothetical protein